jgi:hypothetical protein
LNRCECKRAPEARNSGVGGRSLARQSRSDIDFANNSTGALICVAPDGTRTEIVPGKLFAPGGVAVGSDWAIYVTNNSIFSGTGQVLRIQL